jgi:Eukaryotic mitochondrial regulator protein
MPRTRLRGRMFDWLNGEAAALKAHMPGSTNYLTNLKERNASARAQEKAAAEANSSGSSALGENAADGGQDEAGGNRPFPLNPSFVSERILSEDLRKEIYARVTVKKKSVRAVSVELGVDMRRVGAVVRLVELEKRWRKEVCFPSLFLHFTSSLLNARRGHKMSKSISLKNSSNSLLEDAYFNKLQLSEMA